MFLSIVLAVCFVSSIHGEKLHEHMTSDEIQSVFNVHHDAVQGLDYQLVKIIHLDPRNASDGRRTRMSKPNLHLKAFDQNYSLYLEENDNVLLGSSTPVFIAKANPRKRSAAYRDEASIVYSRIQYPLPASFKLYHDRENRAALSVDHENDDRFHVNGIVGDDIVIRSLPRRVHDEVLTKFSTRSKRASFFDDDSLFNDPNSIFGDTYKTTHHVIIRPNPNDNRPVFGSIDAAWNEIKNNYLNNNDDDPFHYIPWKNVQKTYNSSGRTYNRNNDSSTSYVSWQNSYKPYNSSGRTYVSHVTWRPTYEPFTWRPTTKAPYTWRPATRLPVTWWRRPTVPTVSWYQPSIKDPITWIRPATNKPFTLPTRRPTVESRWPIYTRFPTRIPTTLPTNKPVTSTTAHRFPTKVPVTPAPPAPGTKRSETVYPQLLITVDYDTFKAHGSDVEEVSKYMAAFWNAVDLRYRELNSPDVRLNIAGLIIPKQPNSASYMEEHRVSADSAKAGETLETIGKYFAKNLKEFPKDTWDIVVGMTKSDLGDVDRNGKFVGGTTGIAYFKGACKIEYGIASALVRDKGGFNGITTAAHEVAHALGAPHDGNESANVRGGPCSWEDGYLMSYNRKDKKGMHFSKCSAQAMRDYFRKPEAKCLQNKPNTGSPYPKLLPGKVLSRDEQCKRTMGDKWVSYKGYESNCATLWCKDTTSTNILTHYRPPAEGTYCGEGAICLNAECVKDPELS